MTGAFEGQHCGLKVDMTNVCQTAPVGLTMCGQAHATSSFAQMAGQGDSGGTVYTSIGGTNYGVGIVINGAGNVFCTEWGAQFNRRCSSDVWFTQVDYLFSKFGVSQDW